MPLPRSHAAAALVAAASLAACLSTPTVTAVDGGSGLEGGGASSSSLPVASSGQSSAASTGDASRAPADAGLDATLADARVGMDGTAPLPDVAVDAPLPRLDADLPGDGGASRCTASPTMITCTEQLLTIMTPAGSDPEAGTTYPAYQRAVHYQVPLGTAPAAGWPAVFMFQGSFLSAAYTFSASSAEDYGMYYQTGVVKVLLDAGYAVLAPEALDSGGTYWQTNIAPYAASWSGAPDDVLVQTMLADVSSGKFGPLDPHTLFATGISSGGYMSSRMALSYTGKFKALAIESGAWATCLSGESAITGGMCTVPALDATHPPTLFLHGDEDTVIVPEWTVMAYETALHAAGVTYKEVDDANSGHQWIPEAPAAVLSWFDTYR